MSGWRRLWIVLSLIAGVPTFAIAFDADKLWIYRSTGNPDEMRRILAEEVVIIRRQCANPPSRIAAEDSGGFYTFAFRCERNSAYFRALLWALLPALVMAGIGYVIRWVYRGFRPAKSLPEQA